MKKILFALVPIIAIIIIGCNSQTSNSTPSERFSGNYNGNTISATYYANGNPPNVVHGVLTTEVSPGSNENSIVFSSNEYALTGQANGDYTGCSPGGCIKFYSTDSIYFRYQITSPMGGYDFRFWGKKI